MNWHFKINKFEMITILVVTVTTIISNLVYAVFVGTALAGLIAAWNIGKKTRMTSEIIKSADGSSTKLYTLEGPLFFGSKKQFVKMFDLENDPDSVQLDLSKYGEPFDYSALEAINVTSLSYKRLGKKFEVRVKGLPEVEAMFKTAGKLV